jgi:hypothetical protein
LECGARAFDARPLLQDGTLEWHHGGVAIKVPFASSVADTISWLSNHPSELVLFMISDCSGTGCVDAVSAALAAQNVSTIADCGDLSTLTLPAAMQRGRLATGGAFLGITGAGGSSGVACAEGNYDPSIACSGFGSADTATPAALTYGCWQSDSTRQKPVGQMLAYLDSVDKQGLSATQFVQAQALWQESDDSVAIGTLRNSSLLVDEEKSGLNAMLTSEIRKGRWPDLRMVEVNNVCDGGPALLAALRNRT